MKLSTVTLALLVPLGLMACDKPPPPAPVAVPGPAGPQGATGSQGNQGNPGEPGKPADGTTVIVVPPAASAPTN